MLNPRLCNARDFAADWYRDSLSLLKEGPLLHRKQWEFCAIARVLRERGLLEPGRRGLGFAVGLEPLPALFRSLGVEVLATDQPATAEARSLWGADAGQLCLEPDRAVDMRHLPDDLGTFDFLWSAGSFEHIGGIDAGLDFVVAAMDCLRPGGVAVHTTEFNCGAGHLEGEHLSLYRQGDFARLADRLAARGDRLLPIDWSLDDTPATEGALPHLKLRIGEFVTTSILIIAEKASS